MLKGILQEQLQVLVAGGGPAVKDGQVFPLGKDDVPSWIENDSALEEVFALLRGDDRGGADERLRVPQRL